MLLFSSDVLTPLLDFLHGGCIGDSTDASPQGFDSCARCTHNAVAAAS